VETETFHAEIGIRDGRIVTIAKAVTDAEDRIVMTGGIERMAIPRRTGAWA
jgi:N-acyl-D-aspartate/D-glutamate deacylase